MANTTSQKTVFYGTREVIKAGTPIDTNGLIANNATAIGVVYEDAFRPAKATVLTAGTFNYEFGYANSGIALSEECRAALIAIEFVNSDGVALKPPVQSVPYGGTAGQILTKGATGYEWAAAPTEIPAEGTAGQVLTKTEDALEWADVPTEIPEDGTAGQVLTKTEEAFEWADLPEEAAAE